MILTEEQSHGGTIRVASRSQHSSTLPVIIAGGGCVGLFLALLLAHSPIPNRIIVIEPEQPDPSSTRAMAHQPLTYPILSQVPGLLPELIEKGSLSNGLCFRTSVKYGSEVIAGKKFDNTGEGMKGKGQLLLPQGKFQGILMRRLEGFKAKVQVRIGQRVESFAANAGSVAVKICAAGDDEEKTEDVEVSYLIGADGAHSTVRKQLGVQFEGETLDQQLVATDLYFDFHKYGWEDANFIVDTEDFGLVGRISPLPAPAPSATSTSPPLTTDPTTPNETSPLPLWRVSFSLPSHLTSSQIQDLLPEKLSRILPNAGLNPTTGQPAYTIIRIAPYTPHQRLSSHLYSPNHRTCLIGDAAHLTNPYAGLGLASGIADASSLATVLTRVLCGKAWDSEVLLQTWDRARGEVFGRVVDGPSRMAYGRVQSDVSSRQKVEEFVERDGLVRGLRSGVPVRSMGLETRGEELEGW